MVRLNLEGVWIDIGDFDFEMKWKHPINNNLKGESSTYSTDITAPLTENNRKAFDYKVFTASSKTNRYSYGAMYINGTIMNVRCYIKTFKSDSVVFFVEQFLKGGVSAILKDQANLPDIFAADIQAGAMRDVLIDVQNGNAFVPTLPENAGKPTTPNIFHAIATPYADSNGTQTTRPSVYADQNLLQKIADHYGFTLNNAPTNYWVFSNQWKVKNSVMIDGSGNFSLVPLFLVSERQYNLYGDASNRVVSVAPFKLAVRLYDLTFSSTGLDLYFVNSENAKVLLYSQQYVVELGTSDINFSANIPAGTWRFAAYEHGSTSTPVSFSGKEAYTASIYYEGAGQNNIDDAVDFAVAGLYPCWQNLPKVTAKTLIETIALCAGKMVKYRDNVVDFIDFEDVFDWHNAIDVSGKLISWEEKSFRYLDYNNATVAYKSGKVIASVQINDETLNDETNAIATIDALRIEDDTENDRNKDSIVLRETTDGHFDIINKLADIYTPLINTKMFQATFIYFEGSQKPLLIRQLGGIFIALESIITTKNTISLKLLRIK